MQTLANLLWLVLAGWWLAIAYVGAAVANAMTIIGIPFAVQSLKLAGFSLWPFGRVVVEREGANQLIGVVGNVLWFILGGVWLALGHLLAALLLALTIIGIPFAVANLKLARLALFPFGVTVVEAAHREGQRVVVEL